jgi:DNA (cytosine-5)-methyltransferase 1
MATSPESHFDHQGGTAAPWYEARDLTDEKREFFRDRSRRSREAKLRALEPDAADAQPIYLPALDPADLMPQVASHLLPALSLFSGGGGLDLGFERAGFGHVASFDTLEAAGKTLQANRPKWEVHSGAEGDVRQVKWRAFRGELAVLHGGPPCQPFSVAGRQRGDQDARNMLPEFVRAVDEAEPLAFVCENVPALAGPKFAPYLRDEFLGPLARRYRVTQFKLSAHDFGVPQLRHRVFFVGFRRAAAADRFAPPTATHRADHLASAFQPPVSTTPLEETMGTRAALGLPDIGADGLAPTLRSTLTGPRHTTSILSSVSAQRSWAALEIWPNGVAKTRAAAARFATENGHRRLAVADCAVLQGFPSWWHFHGAVYMSLGQIGNSVAPPVAYRVALAVAQALGFAERD